MATIRSQPKQWALLVFVGVGLIFLPAAFDAVLSHYSLTGIEVLRLGGFQSGILTAIISLGVVGWAVLARVRHSLFHYKGTFEYEPYFST